jgi:HemY protein
MLRAIRFLLIAAILLGLAWAIGNLPGTLVAHAGAYTVATTVPVAIILLAVIVALLVVLLRLLGSVRRAPGGFGNWRSSRRERQGELATERGIVALAAGDAAAASTQAAIARKALGDAPLALLLTAEAARLAGKTEQANAAFEQLTKHKNLAFLGHRGLLRHHLAGGDHEAATSHALAAQDAYPGGTWLKTQRLDLAVKKQDYRAALTLARTPAEIAALATAAANTAAAPADAMRYAKQAMKTAPAFAPAIAGYAAALRRSGRDRAARQALAKGWAAAPHPLLAASWFEKIASPIERAQAAAELAKNAPGHPESELLLAETALAAQLTGEARRHVNAAIQAGLTDKRAFSVLAKLDPGIDAVTAAANAPAPRWHCDHCSAETEAWTAICPSCGKAGTLSWTTGGAGLPAVPSQATAQLPAIMG